MSNFILGSGLPGLAALDILGEKWNIIPCGRSRYYSFNPALWDNYIRVSDSMLELFADNNSLRYHRAFSFHGKLIRSMAPWLADMYSEKVYGGAHPLLAKMLWLESKIFATSANEMYASLFGKHRQTIEASRDKYGVVEAIQPGVIKTTKGDFLYENIISTIPLDSLLGYVGIPSESLTAKDVWIYNVLTDQLDFEGCDEVLVLEPEIDFFKVQKVDKFAYVFYCLKEIKTPQQYFGYFTNGKCEIPTAGSTMVPKALPTNIPAPEIPKLNDMKIKLIGRNARWDDMVDLNTCMMQILKMPT